MIRALLVILACLAGMAVLLAANAEAGQSTVRMSPPSPLFRCYLANETLWNLYTQLADRHEALLAELEQTKEVKPEPAATKPHCRKGERVWRTLPNGHRKYRVRRSC